MMIKKAVLPVAGMGTRFFPATKVVPKELLPLGNKPVIQYLVEEAVSSGIEEIIFVISKGKELIKDHFLHNPNLEDILKKRGKNKPLEEIDNIHNLAKFTYVYQDEPLGDGHAILMAEEAIGGEPFLVLFGDDIVKGDVPAAKQLMDKFDGESIMAVEKIPQEKTCCYGVIKPNNVSDKFYEVIDMVEKPSPDKAPSDLGIIGKYICSPEIFNAIRGASTGQDGEMRLIDGFIKLKNDQKVWAVEIKGQRFDTGTPEGLVEASRAFLGD